MSLFKNILKQRDNNQKVVKAPWVPLDNINQLDAIVEASKTKPQLLFKHSTRCGISRMVKKQFETAYTLKENEADLYYLDLLNYRDVSNAVSTRFKVIHESPQLLVIKQEKVIVHVSHGAINELDLLTAIS